MVGFPNIPFINGASDEEASIHVNTRIGPSIPLAKRNLQANTIDQEILQTINDQSNDDLDTSNLSEIFKLSLQRKQKLHDENENSSDSDTYGEEEDEEIHKFEEVNHDLTKYEVVSQVSAIKIFAFSFIVSSIVLVVTYLLIKSPPQTPQRQSHFKDLNALTNDVSKRQDILESNIETLNQRVTSKLHTISEKLKSVEGDIKTNSNQLLELSKEFKLVTNRPNIDESLLNQIDEKLSKVTKIYEDFDSLKKSLLDELLESLPSHVPVFIKNKKIHFVPQFQSYIHTFIENYVEKTRSNIQPVTWDKFIETNGDQFNSLLDTKLVKFIDRSQFEKVLVQRFKINNKHIFEKVDDLIGNLDLGSNTTAGSTPLNIASNKILLNTLLETFAKGSVKVNYADYNLGSRILGFLTKLNLDPLIQSNLKSRSFAGKVLFGWYDYFTSASVKESIWIKSPKYWKYNANNVLVDDGSSWECESNHCSLGFRMFNSLILTDLVIKSIPQAETVTPSLFTLFVKPKNSQQVSTLVDYLKPAASDTDHNKYLKKFIKVKEFKISTSQPITHIKIPISLINLKIPTRDIYLEVKSQKNTKISLSNIKAYGISEFNSYKYSQEFELILDKLYEEKEEDSVKVVDLNDLYEDVFDADDFVTMSLGEDDYLL